MKIIEVKTLEIPEIKVIKFQKFNDNRGYFSETFRKTDMDIDERCNFLHGEVFNQFNESFSKAGTIRGLHFQWNPFMGKLIRCISGQVIDLALDIRKNSPTFGKIIAYELDNNHEVGEWIWLPKGFAHGVFTPVDSILEYMCTGQWSPNCETAISIFSEDIDWSFCDENMTDIFQKTMNGFNLISEKDRNGKNLSQWLEMKESDLFIYEGE